jgi:hypothetical protein
MQRGHLDDLLAFVAVGQERRFTVAVIRMVPAGFSRSSLTAPYASSRWS